ncbi:MAG: hypothetical protein QM504_02770 [Pseudomonadota bacterium]
MMWLRLWLICCGMAGFATFVGAGSWDNTVPVASEQVMFEAKLPTQQHFTSKDRTTFYRLYKKHHKPKFVILFNRELSGDVNDWRENSRLVVDNDTKISLQRKTSNYPQLNFPQEWIWQFEQGFVQIFERLRVRLVDIRTAKRLTAASAMDSQALTGMVNSLKKNEMDAISKYANYYIELLIIRSSQSDFGFQLKASMIDTKTGEIIARVNSLSWKDSQSGVYRASKHGYSEQNNSSLMNKNDQYEASKKGYVKNQNPEIDAIANYLAEKLIKKINYAWAN